ncbi:MAG: hypothetical protein PHE89_02670 [Alphaproteobacteria bacterium]|nr:hypothetical protein [Alphaproteobacteria bacterium]
MAKKFIAKASFFADKLYEIGDEVSAEIAEDRKDFVEEVSVSLQSSDIQAIDEKTLEKINKGFVALGEQISKLEEEVSSLSKKVAELEEVSVSFGANIENIAKSVFDIQASQEVKPIGGTTEPIQEPVKTETEKTKK